MSLQLIKKLFGHFQIENSTLSKSLTVVEFLGFALCVVTSRTTIFRNFGSYHLLFLIFNESLKWVIDIIILLCLALEFFGLQKQIYRVMVFSCVFRCIWIFFLILATISMSVVGFIHIDHWVIGSPPPIFWYEFNNQHILDYPNVISK